MVAKGQGIGKTTAMGNAYVVKAGEVADPEKAEGKILVTVGTDKDMVPAIERCVGIVAEEGGLTSHAAVVGLTLGKPVIVGVENATSLLQDEQELTIDAESGAIYHGQAHII